MLLKVVLTCIHDEFAMLIDNYTYTQREVYN